MADWNKIWEKRLARKALHNTGTKRAVGQTNSAAFIKKVIKRRAKNKVARRSRKANR